MDISKKIPKKESIIKLWTLNIFQIKQIGKALDSFLHPLNQNSGKILFHTAKRKMLRKRVHKSWCFNELLAPGKFCCGVFVLFFFKGSSDKRKVRPNFIVITVVSLSVRDSGLTLVMLFSTGKLSYYQHWMRKK